MRFQVLGLVGAWAGDVRIEVRGSKMRTFLAALLLARGRVVSDAQLMQMLWDERLPTTAQAQIQTYASRLRSLLGAEARIVRQPPGYRLDVVGRAQLDLVEFEDLATRGSKALADGRSRDASKLLRAALDTWNGHSLGGVTDHLAAVEQPRLEEARQTVLERRIDAELTLGEHQALITELTALTAAEPLRERPRMQLMTALHRSGRTADALSVYRDFRTTLADALGLDPSTELRELHQSILTSLPARSARPVELRTRRPELGPALPPEPRDFVGRAAEAAKACATLTGSPAHRDLPAVCAISGMCGTGKTTLALRVARLLRDQYPDRQILVDLGGRRAQPPDARAVLAATLTQLGMPAVEIPDTLAARVELYRRTLLGTRTLLVLDDAHHERQVRPLLPGVPGCGVLVTSRSPLAALEGAIRIPLDVLSQDDSVRLLSQIVGVDRVTPERGAAERIAELCGHLPVAVRVAGARLATRPHWPLTRLADRLEDPHRLLEELQAGDLSVRHQLMPTLTALAPQLRAVLARLAELGSGSFTAAAAADLLGMSTLDTLDLLDELVATHMLRAESLTPDRYRLPGLVLALTLTQKLLRYAG